MPSFEPISVNTSFSGFTLTPKRSFIKRARPALCDRFKRYGEVLLDHEVAGRHGGEFGQKGVGAFLALGTADEAVAEQILFGDDGDRGRDEAVVEGDDGIAASRLVGYPLVGLLAASSMIAAVFLAGRLRRAPVVEVHASAE